MPGREEFKREYLESIAETCSKPFAECSRMERYTALAAMIRECCSGVRAETLRRRAAAGEKIVYYFSMEFLVGRLLENYLIQLGIRDMTADILAELGEDLDALLECERDPGLGNGGLGRLAACYLDSLAAEDVPCVGMGLRYRYGLFRQRIRSGCFRCRQLRRCFCRCFRSGQLRCREVIPSDFLPDAVSPAFFRKPGIFIAGKKFFHWRTG